MSYNLIKFVQDEIDSGIGDIERLRFILNSLKKDKTLYKSDQKYLESRISKHAKKIITSRNEIENVFKNNETQNIDMITNLQDYDTESGQDQQTALFLNKSEMSAQHDIQKTILKIRQKLENVLERIEKLERNFLEESKFELIEPDVEQNYLPNELHDFTEKQKSNNTEVKSSGENNDKQKMDKNILTIAKVLLVMTIVTIVSAFVILWFFGTLEGKPKWQDYGLSYTDASTIVHCLLFAIILILVAWPAFGITRIITYKKRK